MNYTEWLSEWYLDQCNGDWEHQYGIEIGTIDNPGWSLKVDLVDTNKQGKSQEYIIIEKSDYDWYSIKSDGMKYESYGDPSKLNLMIEKFKEFIS